jgi:hypothetical protein
LQREFPKAKVLEVAGAAHPVPFNATVNKFVLASLDVLAASTVKTEPHKAYEQMDMVLEVAPVWKEPTVVSDVPVEVMKSVEVMVPTPLPVAQPEEPQMAQSVESPVVVAAQPEGVLPPSPATQPSVWAWLKHKLLGATKK